MGKAASSTLPAAGWTATRAGIDPVAWPDVAAVPPQGFRSAVARAIFRRAASRLPLRVAERGRPVYGAGGPASPLLVLHQPAAFFARLGSSGLIGFGESYMAGEWDCRDLTGLLTAFASQVTSLVPARLQWLRHIVLRHVPASDNPDELGARRNAARHYDLSNDLFATFLDPTMTYSAALFEEGPDGRPVTPPPGDPAALDVLAVAQQRKVDRLLDLAGVRPGTRVLEIGTGWGELAIRAGARGAYVRTITLSQQQRDLAAQRVRLAGLTGRVSVELCDYREVTGKFDSVVSVEMIESVGARYWPAFFAALARLLAPGGRVGLQAITMPHDRMLATRNTQTWILKYIFPGGLIPSVTAVETAAARAGLAVAGRRDFGPHYAETLRIWREAFTARAGLVGALGFDAVFRRMWTLYLAYAEAGFRAGYLGVSQFLLRPAGLGDSELRS